jgi:hypothetical protein
MELDELLVHVTSVGLQIEEYFVQDDFVIPSYPGPHLVAKSYAGRLAALTPAGRTVRAVPHATATKILQLAMLARDERVEGGGVDTAIGRTLTCLILEVHHASGPSDSFSASFTINHKARSGSCRAPGLRCCARCATPAERCPRPRGTRGISR